MARARNIKPSFFNNEQVADNSFAGRLLFIGLWTLADFKGDLEWRPRRIKASIFPHDTVDVEALAIALDKSGLIQFYSDGAELFIHIPTFAKHQNPHLNERRKGSDIPEFTFEARQRVELKGLVIYPDKYRSNPEQNGTDPAESLILNPESLSLNPDSGIPPAAPAGTVDASAPRKANRKTDSKSGATWTAYAEAYVNRYGTEPVRNATVNAQLSAFVGRVGAEASPEVARFFVQHNDRFYIQKQHPVGLMLQNAEGLHTQWKSGKSVTQTGARQLETRQALLDSHDEVLAMIESRRTR